MIKFRTLNCSELNEKNVGQKVNLITKSISTYSKKIYFYIENNLIEKYQG